LTFADLPNERRSAAHSSLPNVIFEPMTHQPFGERPSPTGRPNAGRLPPCPSLSPARGGESVVFRRRRSIFFCTADRGSIAAHFARNPCDRAPIACDLVRSAHDRASSAHVFAKSARDRASNARDLVWLIVTNPRSIDAAGLVGSSEPVWLRKSPIWSRR
jgi:hypothetical protein